MYMIVRDAISRCVVWASAWFMPRVCACVAKRERERESVEASVERERHKKT